MKIHIGDIIKQRAKELRIGPSELGRRINTSRQNVYGIFKRKSVDSELLKILSEVLEFNFFSYYTLEKEAVAYEPTSYYLKATATPSHPEYLYREMENLRKELHDLKEKYELQKKVNALLEKELIKRWNNNS